MSPHIVTGVDTGWMFDSVHGQCDLAVASMSSLTFHHVLFDYLAELLHVVF
jgi:hypothetical protein